MVPEKRIDDLIEAGWHVLYSDFDAIAFRDWRNKAFACLHALLGPDHMYTRSFRRPVQEPAESSLLVGGGILTAAKETVVNQVDLFRVGDPESSSAHGASETDVLLRG
jgi:hypothetical protein